MAIINCYLTDGIIFGEETFSPPNPELAVNGDFSAWTGGIPDGWQVYEGDENASIEEDPNGMRMIRDGSVAYCRQDISGLVAGEWLEIKVTIHSWNTTGGANWFVFGPGALYPTLDYPDYLPGVAKLEDSDGTGTFTFRMQKTAGWFYLYAFNPCDVVISNVSIKRCDPVFPFVTYRSSLADGIVFGEQSLNSILGLLLNVVRIRPIPYNFTVLPITLDFPATVKNFAKDVPEQDKIITSFEGKEVVMAFEILPLVKTFYTKTTNFNLEALNG